MTRFPYSDRTVRTSEDVDQTHNRVAVGRGSAYDLFLTPELKAPQIARAPSSPNVAQTFLEQNLEVAADVKHQLEKDTHKTPGLRLLHQRFMVGRSTRTQVRRSCLLTIFCLRFR